MPAKSKTRPKGAKATSRTAGVKSGSAILRSVGRLSPAERIAVVRAGVPAEAMRVLADDMAVPLRRFYETVHIPEATGKRKLRDKQSLSVEEGERVLFVAQLIAEVRRVVTESGDPAGFNAAEWVADWLERPLPALGGQRPSAMLDTADGRSAVLALIGQAQAGVFG
jgi:putative toxin-antitoxin system antitoxin component (TIGR02293 family)